MQAKAQYAPFVSHLRTVIQSDPLSVREGLGAMLASPLLRHLAAADRGTAEIVLAEALNNIVEHAYAGDPGSIAVDLALDQTALQCQIEDHGRPMPGETLPSGELRSFEGWDDLPEGGFGWHLIRTLSCDLSYRRDSGRNLLRFRLEREQSAS